MTKLSNTRTATHTPMRRLFGAIATLLLLCAATPAAHAQWEVTDQTTHDTLGEIKSDTSHISTRTDDLNNVLGTTANGGNQTMNANLDSINKKLIIGDNYSADQPGVRMGDPTQALPTPTSTAKLDDGVHCQSVAQPQQATCQKIVDIENAQYQYMLTVYATSKTRDDMLRALLKEREQINSGDPNQYGKLENNTNKLTALYNLIALDQQQMQAVNYAYEANLRYLRATQTLAANAAATGKTTSSLGSINIPGIGGVDIGSAISGLTTGAALATALKGVQSSTPSGMKTLGIGDSNGW
ncbi:hypothetical protein EC912_101219 [Luteibacter rhizovicinus]|uniref:Uncharacterized protein n=1 Tax=Luteibacter rhizovicinus TaxID=242606 RepID=A0A4R3Z091_9GAMM|nr:hypothetical protein [Luteibacter rhizovicinus]TCV97224.1 hypothetical protein EC912_101219 [Luteibacter rhizovicinus]